MKFLLLAVVLCSGVTAHATPYAVPRACQGPNCHRTVAPHYTTARPQVRHRPVLFPWNAYR